MFIVLLCFSLEAYDRNQNFGNAIDIVEPAHLDSWPTNLEFRQLTLAHRSVIPAISYQLIESMFDDAPTCKGKITAVEKGQKLVDAGKVAGCSFATQESDCLFFTGFIKAAMKKKVSYNFRVKMSTDGIMESATCECPAGAGPLATCKHIAALMIVLAHFSQTGILHIENTCTDTLQQFSRPRKLHTDSPVKIETFKKPRNSTSSILCDIRPSQFRKRPGYRDFVRNSVINYVSATHDDVTIRYLYSKADLQAASHDHDYLEVPYLEYAIDRTNEISTAEAARLEIATRSQHRSVLWHEQRHWRLTASNFGTIIRCLSSRSRDRLCARLANPPILKNKAVLHGKKYETVALHKFEEITSTHCKPAGLFVRPEYPYLGASPDGVVDEDRIVEIKCPYSGRNNTIEIDQKFPYLFLNNEGKFDLKRNHRYYSQVQGQLFITGRKVCHFVVYTFQSVLVIDVPIDMEYCKESLIPKLSLFYCRHYRKYMSSLL